MLGPTTVSDSRKRSWWPAIAIVVATLIGNGAYWSWRELQLNTIVKTTELRNNENQIYRDIVELSESYIAAQQESVGKTNDPRIVAKIMHLHSQLERRKGDFTALETRLAQLESRQPQPLTIFFPTPTPPTIRIRPGP